MVKVFFISLFFFIGMATIQAQLYVDGIRLDSIYQGKYLSGEPFFIKREIYFKIETDKKGDAKKQFITDQNGERTSFETHVAIINFFDKNGWEMFSYSDSRDTSLSYKKLWFRRIEQ
ncbi:MAG: hypothetical protein R2828_27355 [Saprospiraceae bacterium]